MASGHERDERMMARALVLAARARGRTSPNPMVGAVVVDARGRVLAEGFHRKAGTDHGEVAALRKLDFSAPGATLYVTLEPCDHHGRTGPCTDVILGAGITRVVVGMRDPNALVDGRGIRKLRRHGLRVDVGVLEERCQALNRSWVGFIRRGRPYIILKAAVTLDGFLASSSGDSRWVTGPPARTVVHELRSVMDAILVGAGTVKADDPELTTRLPSGKGRDPLRVVLDGGLTISPRSRLFTSGTSSVLVVAAAASGQGAGARRVRALERAGAEVLLSPSRPNGQVALPWLCRELARRGVVSLLVEGGGAVNASFLEADLIDELWLFQAPKLLGGQDGVPLFRGPGGKAHGGGPEPQGRGAPARGR